MIKWLLKMNCLHHILGSLCSLLFLMEVKMLKLFAEVTTLGQAHGLGTKALQILRVYMQPL